MSQNPEDHTNKPPKPKPTRPRIGPPRNAPAPPVTQPQPGAKRIIRWFRNRFYNPNEEIQPGPSAIPIPIRWRRGMSVDLNKFYDFVEQDKSAFIAALSVQQQQQSQPGVARRIIRWYRGKFYNPNEEIQPGLGAIPIPIRWRRGMFVNQNRFYELDAQDRLAFMTAMREVTPMDLTGPLIEAVREEERGEQAMPLTFPLNVDWTAGRQPQPGIIRRIIRWFRNRFFGPNEEVPSKLKPIRWQRGMHIEQDKLYELDEQDRPAFMAAIFRQPEEMLMFVPGYVYKPNQLVYYPPGTEQLHQRVRWANHYSRSPLDPQHIGFHPDIPGRQFLRPPLPRIEQHNVRMPPNWELFWPWSFWHRNWQWDLTQRMPPYQWIPTPVHEEPPPDYRWRCNLPNWYDPRLHRWDSPDVQQWMAQVRAERNHERQERDRIGDQHHALRTPPTSPPPN